LHSWVVDTNILISFEKANLLEKFFSLPFEFFIPSTVIDELKKHEESYVRIRAAFKEANNVRIKRCGSEEYIYKIAFIREKHKNLSITDLSLIVLAGELKCGILTGDKSERIKAEQKGIEVHGLLWILDQMVCEAKLIAPSEAIKIVGRLTETYLPEKEKKIFIDKWKKL